MRKFTGKNVELKKLLPLKMLEIRRLVNENLGMLANDYCKRVEMFMNDAPIAKEALERAAGKNGSKETLNEVEGVRLLLENIGAYKAAREISWIADAIENDNMELAEKLVKDACATIDSVFDTIKETLPPKKADMTFPSGIEESEPSQVLMKDAIDYCDYEESTRKLRVLAVDDVAVVLNTITSVLSEHYEVFAIKKSSLVEKFLTHTTPELFLLDIDMPELNGYDLISVIRKFEEHKDTPIIFLTGNANIANLKTAVALGACDFITKPVDRKILLEKIENRIVRKKLY